MQRRTGLEASVCHCGHRWDFCCCREAVSFLLGQLIHKISAVFFFFFLLWCVLDRNKPVWEERLHTHRFASTANTQTLSMSVFIKERFNVLVPVGWIYIYSPMSFFRPNHFSVFYRKPCADWFIKSRSVSPATWNWLKLNSMKRCLMGKNSLNLRMHPGGLVPHVNVKNKRIWSAGFFLEYCQNTSSKDSLLGRKLNGALENFVQHVPALIL